MLRKIKITIVTLIILVLSFFSIRIITNEAVIFLSNHDKNPEILIKVLYILNINESYIVYYNNGNINYNNKEYDKAIKNYTISLDKNPPEKRVCSIRINIALATIKNIKVTDKELVIEELKKARSYLYKNDCAHENDDKGKSKKAEELEEEIKKLEKQVEEENSNSNSNNQNNPNNEKQNYDNIEAQIIEKQKQNNNRRYEDLEKSEYLGDYEYYRGKRW